MMEISPSCTPLTSRSRRAHVGVLAKGGVENEATAPVAPRVHDLPRLELEGRVQTEESAQTSHHVTRAEATITAIVRLENPNPSPNP
jgi:hypothetical protein